MEEEKVEKVPKLHCTSTKYPRKVAAVPVNSAGLQSSEQRMLSVEGWKSEDGNGIVSAGFGDKTCNKNDGVQALTCTSNGLLSVFGRRCEMEDAVKVEVTEECKERLHKLLAEEMVEDNKKGSGIDWGTTMERCFEKMDEEVNRGRLAEEMGGKRRLWRWLVTGG
ncbi:hypothetical protein F3Y22_tig00011662pilonHSYRG00069 [Hibiscus syriacus]|uniref:Uncharacterized protein n=1 Tax=Hibiscus syriacus TaxID=106335 RepID=A0A6A3C9X7_HIBSY|nr:hypothetical protein F3Y22_tig00011662pilonHSYRG00069 [Hibiscus syriacus]